MKSKHLLLLGAALYCPFTAVNSAFAQGTGFTYQGRLTDGTNAANGSYDMRFYLRDASSGGSPVGTTNTLSAVGVTNGLFTAMLDFGAGVFTGPDRWLEMGVRTNGGGAFITLNPRQKLTPVPYAITASNLTGALPASQLSGTLPSSQLSGTYSGLLTLNNAGNSFTGNGAGLANVNAVALGGYGYCSLPCYWKLTGNAGTVPGGNFVGTTDNQALELKVNSTRAFRLEPNATSPNVIGGYSGNAVTGGAVGATVGGGGSSGSVNNIASSYGSIGGGSGNFISSLGGFSTVAGGETNRAEGGWSTISGGKANLTRGSYDTISGGFGNRAFPSGLSGSYGTIGGGAGNVIDLVFFGAYATIGGGQSNYIYNGMAVTIAGGAENESGASGSVIGGGRNNSIFGSDLAPSPQDAVIAGGTGNLIDLGGSVATISGGRENRIQYVSPDFPDGGTIGGGTSNFVSRSHGTVSGGQNNTATNRYATIGGGNANVAGGINAFVGGGASNSAVADYSAISGGTGNTAYGQHSTIAGGLGNIAGSDSATVGGGRSNQIFTRFPAPVGSTIAGGSGNQIWTGNPLDGLSDFATIGGGENNILKDETDHSVVGGGGGNSIGSWSSYCAISGGLQNSIVGNGNGNSYYDTIGGGYLNQITTQFSGARGATVSGGIENTASGYAATIPGGAQAKASNHGQMAYASGQFAANGDAQTSLFVCRRTTANATLTELFLDGASERMSIPVNSTWAFEVLVTGRSSTGNSAGYQIRGTIKNNAGTTTIVGAPSFTLLGEDVAAWDASVAADNVNDALIVQVNGSVGTSVRWVASVRTTEVSY